MIDLSVNGTEVPVSYIEYRSGDGLVFRLATDIEGVAAVGEGLSTALRGGPYRLYRGCCDSSPKIGEKHAELCAADLRRRGGTVAPPKKGKVK